MAETMECVLEILDPTGHVALRWDPDDPESLANAAAEFDRLREAGFAFFVEGVPDEPIEAMDDVLLAGGSLDMVMQPKPEKVKTFRPRARRTVAVAPMRGG